MQYVFRDYSERKHDLFKCLTVKQPYADKISTGEKRIEIRKKPTNYRGPVIISSSKKPFVEGRSGVAICKVTLHDCVPISDLTEHEISSTCIPLEEIEEYGGYAWMLYNPIPLDPTPIKGNLGIFNLVVDRGYLKSKTRPEDILISEGKTLPVLIMHVIAISLACVFFGGFIMWLIKNIENISKVLPWK